MCKFARELDEEARSPSGEPHVPDYDDLEDNEEDIVTSLENFREINKMLADIPAIMHMKCAAHTLQLGVEDGLKEQE